MTGQLPWTTRSHKRCGPLLEAWDRLPLSWTSRWRCVREASKVTWCEPTRPCRFPNTRASRHRRIQALSLHGSCSEAWRSPQSSVRTLRSLGMVWLSSTCQSPRWTRRPEDATGRMRASASGDMIPDVLDQETKLCCSHLCRGVTVRWADTRYALTTRHSGVQFDFDSRVDGMPRRLCSATGRVPPLSYRSSGWPVFAWVLCEGDLRDWPRQVLQRWAQHAFRVAGAQLFARAELDLHVIMLIGRWGSSAICRYVQEAALANPTRAAQAVASRTAVIPAGAQPSRPAQLAILPAALDQVRAVVADCFRGQGVIVHNVRSKLAHKPCATECSTPSGDWLSACGRWKYGKASCQRNPTLLPGFRHCPLCFTEESSVAEVLESKDLAPEGSDSSSSSV